MDNKRGQACLLTSLGKHNGIKAAYAGKGNSWQSMLNSAGALAGKSLYLYITFAEGAHAIWPMVVPGAPPAIIIFDPNIGIMGAEGNADANSLVRLLWAEYSSWGMQIQTWKLYELKQKETVMAKWKRGAFG